MPSTVVLGGGIIGLSTAYYLSKLSPESAHSIHIVEPSPELFASASGKAAGFLAKDWFAPAQQPLGLLSFDLHRQLAHEHNGRARWGYSQSVGYSLDRDSEPEPEHAAPAQAEDGLDWLMSDGSRAALAENGASHKAKNKVGPQWLRYKPGSLQTVSDKTNTAQVHPLQLCKFLLEQCQANGATLHHPARATALINNDPSDPASSTYLRLELLNAQGGTRDIPCDNIVIAAGCWTPAVYSTLFPNAGRIPRITSVAGHSLVLHSNKWLPQPVATSAPAEDEEIAPCHAVFASDPSGFSPEVFSRVGGDVWLGGLNSSSIPLPALPTDAAPEDESVARLKSVARRLCGADVEVLRAGLCFRPVTPAGRPVIAKMHEADLGDGVKLSGGGGVFVAAGHGPWGICLSLGTGKVVSEMVLGRPTSADISALGKW